MSARSNIWLRRSLKILHTVGSGGMLGALAGSVALIFLAPVSGVTDYVEMRQAIALLGDYILLPSLALVLVSGLLAMAAHTPFLSKGWVLVKAAFGIIMFKGTLHLVGAQSAFAEELGAAVAAGTLNTVDNIAGPFAYERTLMIAVLVLSIANVVVGVWRPSFSKSKKPRIASGTENASAKSIS